MATYAKKKNAGTSELDVMKKNIERFREYFDDNYKRFHWFMRFIFETSLGQDDIDTLMDVGKPILEFNVLETYISRLLGEFIKHEPSVEVIPSHDIPAPVDIATVQVVDGYLRHVLAEAKRKGYTAQIYRDLLGGGFSVMEVLTDYDNDRTFNQSFKIERVDDPTMCGFDVTAKNMDKSDGEFCFKIYPRTYDEIKEKYPEADIDQLSYTREIGGYSWSYKNEQGEKFILLAEYYKKKKEPIKLVRLSNNIVLTDKQYKEMLKTWKEKKIMAVPPTIVEQRNAFQYTICRHTLIENKILAEEDTDFSGHPLIFVDGNSVTLRQDVNGPVTQITRPAVYHARDIQKLKNFAGQTLANALENQVQHKFLMPVEGLHQDYRSAYEDVQHADVLMYNATTTLKNGQTMEIPPPREVQQVATPPEVSNTFQMADGMAQNILGTFDLSMGKLNDTQLSGIAIQEALTASNANAMPIINGYMLALTTALNFIVQGIPKYIRTPRTIPTLDAEGKRSFQSVNDPNNPQSVSVDYSDNALSVEVEAGLNFSIQKARTLQQIMGLMQGSQLFEQFMNQKGLRILIDNLEIRGGDQLKLLADSFMQEMQQQQEQQAQANSPQNNPMIQVKQAELQLKAQKQQDDMQIKSIQIQLEQAQLDNDRLKLALEQQQAKLSAAVQISKSNAENNKTAVDAAVSAHDQALKHSDQMHRHAKETMQLHHQLSQPQQQPGA